MHKKMKNISVSILFISLVLNIANVAYSKCSIGLYVISGEIKETCSEKSISNVRLYIFFDEDERSSGDYETKTSYSAISDNTGDYVGKIYFSKFSGGTFFGDQCDYRPKIIEVVAVNENYYSTKTKYKISDLKLIEENEDYTSFALPPIVLSPIKN